MTKRELIKIFAKKIKKAVLNLIVISNIISLPYLTTFLSVLPGVNPGAFLAAIVIFSPVFGLRPIRSTLWRTENVPNPVITTFSPRFRASRIEFIKAWIESLDALLVKFAFFATTSISSLFVKSHHPPSEKQELADQTHFMYSISFKIQ